MSTVYVFCYTVQPVVITSAVCRGLGVQGLVMRVGSHVYNRGVVLTMTKGR